jgi:hypothetical protein
LPFFWKKGVTISPDFSDEKVDMVSDPFFFLSFISSGVLLRGSSYAAPLMLGQTQKRREKKKKKNGVRYFTSLI